MSAGRLAMGSGGQAGQQDGRCFFGADGHRRLPNGLSPQGGKRRLQMAGKEVRLADFAAPPVAFEPVNQAFR